MTTRSFDELVKELVARGYDQAEAEDVAAIATGRVRSLSEQVDEIAEEERRG